MSAPSHAKVAIIGGGPAGLTAAIYAARASLSPVVFMGMESASQMFTTTEVENFPSHEKIMGPELVTRMGEQAEKCGASLIYEDVGSVDLSSRPFKITHGYDGEVCTCDTLIIATGATARRLDVPGEKKYWQKGVSACAVCDSMMAKGNDVVVVGGGDVACEEAQHISKIAKKVYLILRRDTFRASAAMVQKVKSIANIEIVYNSGVEEIKGDEKGVTSVTLKNFATGEAKDLPVQGLYWAVGHVPQTKFLNPAQISLDKAGYVLLKDGASTYTSVEGVFAAGDCADHVYRQAIVAAGTGARAAIDAERWLAEHE